MKSFYASCAALDQGFNPLLKKEYGIRTGSRLFEIPDDDHIDVVFVKIILYLQGSTEISRLFNQYVPKEAIHTYSVDESF